MVVVMAPEATDEDVDAVVARVTEAGGEAFVSRGVTRTIVGLVGDVDRFPSLDLRAHARRRATSCASRCRTSSCQRAAPPADDDGLGGPESRRVPIGPDTFTLIAGPCAVETPDQTLEAAQMAAAAGATLLRGGAYKPRTTPYAFQGLGEAGLRILADVRAETGLPDRHRGRRRPRRRAGRVLRRHAPGRHAQRAELRAAAGRRARSASR